MTHNLILIFIGLILCFQSIGMRKCSSAVLGLYWGALISFFVLNASNIFTSGFGSTVYDGISSMQLVIIVVVAIGIVILSLLFNKFAAIIDTLMSGLIFTFLIASAFVDKSNGLMIIAAISLIIAIILAIVAFKYSDYAFMISTAFSGALIAILGGSGIWNPTLFPDTLDMIFTDIGYNLLLVFLSIVLGCLGLIVQWIKYNKANHLIEGDPNFKEIAIFGISDSDVMWYSISFLRFIAIPTLLLLILESIGKGFFSDVIILARTILDGMLVGFIPYVVMEKNLKVNLLYILPSLFGYLILIVPYFQEYVIDHTINTLLHVFYFAITWFVVFMVSKLIHNKSNKPLILLLLTMVVYYTIFTWVIFRRMYIDLHIFSIISIVACVLASCFSFRVLKEKNIFNLKR